MAYARGALSLLQGRDVLRPLYCEDYLPDGEGITNLLAERLLILSVEDY